MRGTQELGNTAAATKLREQLLKADSFILLPRVVTMDSQQESLLRSDLMDYAW